MVDWDFPVRLKMLSPVLAVALVGTGLAFMTATSSSAAPVKLYFHSANGGYLADVTEDPFGPDDDSAPDGSTLDAKAPTKTADAEARTGSPFALPGAPGMPTFTLPFVGDVTSLCIDVWVKSTVYVPTTTLGVFTTLNTPEDQFKMAVTTVTGYTNGTLARVTALVKPDGAPKFTIPKDSELMVSGYYGTSNDMTLVYDSVSHPSSITVNATECKAAPVVVPSASASPKPSASASAAPSASATPKPSATATATPTATPTASATATPSGSATATPSATTPAPTTPPPPPAPAQETSLDYTGPSSGRYGDMAIVSARMTLADGSPVPAGAVEFTLGTVVVRYNVNSDGVATGRLPIRVKAGEHVVTARYLANSAYLGAAEQAPFRVDRMPTRCAIARTTSGGNWVVTGTLRDAAGRAVAGQSLHFRFNNRTWKAVRTDRNGRASVTVAPQRGLYTIALPVNAYYAGCSASLRV